MKKILFFWSPAIWHTMPTIALVKELENRSFDVIYYTSSRCSFLLENNWINFKLYPEEYNMDIVANNVVWFLEKWDVINAWIIWMETTDKLMKFVNQEIINEKPILIIHDSFALWGKIWAEKFWIKAVSSMTTFIFSPLSVLTSRLFFIWFISFLKNPFLSLKIRKMDKYLSWKYWIKKWISNDLTMNTEKLNIVYASRKVEPMWFFYSNKYSFIWHSFVSNYEHRKEDKIIYISLWTAYQKNKSFFLECIKLFSNSEYKIVISLWSWLSVWEFWNVSENIKILNFVDQLKILSSSILFIGSWWTNSLREAIYYSCPMIFIPELFEQEYNSMRMKQLWIWIHIRKNDFSINYLKKSFDQIMWNYNYYYNNCERLRKNMYECWWPKKWVDDIIKYISE